MNRITKSWALRHLAIAAIVLGASSGWAATHSKLSPELTSARSWQWVNVIVQYAGLTDRDFAQAQTVGKRGAAPRRLPLINSVAMTVNSSSLASLESNIRVVHVSVDHPVFETSTNTRSEEHTSELQSL